jgi:hypothetical protein
MSGEEPRKPLFNLSGGGSPLKYLFAAIAVFCGLFLLIDVGAADVITGVGLMAAGIAAAL